MAHKKMTINISPDEIMGSEIMKSGDYRFASVGVKKGDKEFMRISYEWSGDDVPEFVMGLMDFMMSNKEEIEEAKEKGAEEYVAFIERSKER